MLRMTLEKCWRTSWELQELGTHADQYTPAPSTIGRIMLNLCKMGVCMKRWDNKEFSAVVFYVTFSETPRKLNIFLITFNVGDIFNVHCFPFISPWRVCSRIPMHCLKDPNSIKFPWKIPDCNLEDESNTGTDGKRWHISRTYLKQFCTRKEARSCVW